MDNNQAMNHEDEIEIDVVAILMDLWRKLPLIIVVGIITAALGFGYSSFKLVPMYQSSTSMYVLPRTTDVTTLTATDIQIGSLLTSDYAEIIKSRNVLEKVIEKLELNMSTGALAAEISVNIPEQTRMVYITVKDSSPVNAMKIADAVREISSEVIRDSMNIEAVNVVDTANLPTGKCSPSIPKYTLLGGIAGIFLMCAFFVIRFILNDSIRTPEDIEKSLGLSVLAVVPSNPNIKKSKKNKK